MPFLQTGVAVLVVAAVARWPRAWPSVAFAAAGGVIVAVLHGPGAVASALATAGPLLVFLTAVLSLAALVRDSGLAERAAALLAVAGRGRNAALYALVCGTTALLTAAVSLDGAVILLVPVLVALRRSFRAPFAPLFLGVVGVANAFSAAVPQGNPTNLVVMGELHLSPTVYVEHMLLPALGAAVAAAGLLALGGRAALAGGYEPRVESLGPLTRDERRALGALAAAAITGWLAPFLGVAPWWPFALVLAGAMLAARRVRLLVPWRVSAQVLGLLLAVAPIGLPALGHGSLGLAGLSAVALGIAAFAACANNLPASVSAAALLSAGPAAYAGLIGLSAGALATPQGSVATLIAGDLAGDEAPATPVRLLVPPAAAGVLTATVLLWLL